MSSLCQCLCRIRLSDSICKLYDLFLCPGWFLGSYEIAIVIVFISLIEVVILKITKLTRLVLLLLILRILVENGSFKCICWILVLLIILYLTKDYETYMHNYDDVHNSIADLTIACEITIVGRSLGRFAFFFETAISETFFLAGTAFFTSLNNEYESYWMREYANDRQLFKGSSDPSHFIFSINVGKSRIRHRTNLKLNDDF